MIKSLRITNFKNFKQKSIELKNLNKINVLVGINGSGKSSILESLALVSRLSRLGSGQLVFDDASYQDLYSLIADNKATFVLGYDDKKTFRCQLIPRAGNIWTVEQEGKPESPIEARVIWDIAPFSATGPLAGIQALGTAHVQLDDLEDALQILQSVNQDQRVFVRDMFRGTVYLQEQGSEVNAGRLAGGTRYLGAIIRAIKSMGEEPMANLLLIDDLGDTIFPALRKAIVPSLKEALDKHPENLQAQVFTSTHNIEIVKSALEHPEYCSVYMLDYDGTLIEFKDGIKKVHSSTGIDSEEGIQVIARMLGLTDLELGFPELVILVEEQTKKLFLEALRTNKALQDGLRKFEVFVPFQAGDGNVERASQNLLDVGKYFFFSEVWSDRYAMFLDYNSGDYQTNGTAKHDTARQKALHQAQQKLGLGQHFLLTKRGTNFTGTIEATYPSGMWAKFKKSHNIQEASFEEWLKTKTARQEKGKAKCQYAKFVGETLSKAEFESVYPELDALLKKRR
ncbi:MAG TPA: AAA family ATPase [Candidatus Acidoferrum sp.]|nr:AAA family ATPase [Candidatus Acidoferrum sp.]